MKRRWLTSESGSGSVLVVLVIAVTLSATVGVLVLASGYTARRSAANAADLAALAAAQRLQTGTAQPCQAAEEIATTNGTQLTDCVIDGSDVEVQVRVTPESRLSWIGEQTRRARATANNVSHVTSVSRSWFNPSSS